MTWLLLLLLLEIALLVIADRNHICWLHGLSILNMLLITMFSARLIQVGPLISNLGCLWYATVFAVQLIVFRRGGYEASRELVGVLYFTLIGFLLIVQVAPLVTPYGPTGGMLEIMATRSLRVTAASLLAFGCGQGVLVEIWRHTKINSFATRYLLAVVAGQAVDSLIFFWVAFGLAGARWRIGVDGFLLKLIFGLCFAPLVWWLTKNRNE